MEPVFEERLSKRQLDLALAGMSALPAIEADNPDDLVDVVHDAFDDDWRFRIPRLLEELRESRFPLFLALDRRRCTLG